MSGMVRTLTALSLFVALGLYTVYQNVSMVGLGYSTAGKERLKSKLDEEGRQLETIRQRWLSTESLIRRAEEMKLPLVAPEEKK